MAVNIKISYHPSSDFTVFGKYSLQLSDEENNVFSVDTKFNFQELLRINCDTTSVAFDFLVFSMLVYSMDRAVSRSRYSSDGWQRIINVENIPARNAQLLNSVSDRLAHCVNFLTGDSWSFHFSQIRPYVYQPIIDILPATQFEKVALFSGGLDSLIGFVDEASTLSTGKKILLISHIEQGKEGGDQNRILRKCDVVGHPFYGKYERLYVNAGLNPRTWTFNPGTEGTFRSRSLLFFAMGLYAAHQISSDMDVIVPENGTISINIPLDRGRRSACSTRTTHPVFIKRLLRVLPDIGIQNKLVNPYGLMTKADMMVECFEQEEKKAIILGLYDESCSCAKRSHKRWWDVKSNVRHCGKCLPCVYRRVALSAVGLDNNTRLGIDMFDSPRFDIANKVQQSSSDMRSLLYFLRSRHNPETIEKELRLNGITNKQELSEYVELVMRSYDQVKEWISHNGTEQFKILAGIQ